MLGQQLPWADRRARRLIQRHHRRRQATLAPCEPTTPSHAGAGTNDLGEGGQPVGEADAPPDGQYTAITASGNHYCALRTDNTITCWGRNSSGEADAPDGQYSAITAGGSHSCALRTDNTITCWGRNSSGEADAPDGQYSAITAGRQPTIAPYEPTTPSHAGAGTARGRPTRPTANTAPSPPAADHSCALRTDNTITCWGRNSFAGQTDAPDGQYSAITAGTAITGHSCALRTDNTITCWGNSPIRADRRARRPIHHHHHRRRTSTLAPCEPTAPSRVGRCCLMGCVGWPAAVNGPPSGRRPGHRLHLCSSGPNGCANPTAATSPAGPSPTM